MDAKWQFVSISVDALNRTAADANFRIKNKNKKQCHRLLTYFEYIINV